MWRKEGVEMCRGGDGEGSRVDQMVENGRENDDDDDDDNMKEKGNVMCDDDDT